MPGRFFIFFLSIFSCHHVAGQIPDQCFVIEDILVDACLTPSSEGENEMLRLRIGSNDLNTANLTADWPNNSFNGICQNPNTAALVTQLNATITIGCGYFVEPENGVLPAGSQVLWFTSENLEIAYHDYSNVDDTLIVIFQCGGNLAGHFANWGTGLRTTTITFTGPNMCSDSKTYDRALLINQQGGIGGSPEIRDGAGVRWNWLTGETIYYNDGCVYPAAPFEAEILNQDTIICVNDVLELEAYSFNAETLTWFGGNGDFSGQNSLAAEYNVSPKDTNSFYIYFKAVSSCRTFTDSIMITPLASSQHLISVHPGLTVCKDDTVLLSTSSTAPHQWFFNGELILGENINEISITQAGNYHAIVSPPDACNQYTDTVEVTHYPVSNIELNAIGENEKLSFCPGDSVRVSLMNKSFTQVAWFKNGQFYADADTIDIFEADLFEVVIIDSNDCSASLTFYPEEIQIKPIEIKSSNELPLCDGEQTIFEISPVYTQILWADGSSANTIIADEAGVYNLTAVDSNGCTVYGSKSLTFTDNPFIHIEQDIAVGCISHYQPDIDSDGTDFHWSPVEIFEDHKAAHAVITVPYNGTIEVTATNSSGCTQTGTTTIEWKDCGTLWLPNAIAPEKANHLFQLLGNTEQVQSLNFSVFNRWGEKVFQTHNPTQYWDGKHNGTAVPGGTYVWVINGTFNDGSPLTVDGKQSGSVIVVR